MEKIKLVSSGVEIWIFLHEKTFYFAKLHMYFFEYTALNFFSLDLLCYGIKYATIFIPIKVSIFVLTVSGIYS